MKAESDQSLTGEAGGIRGDEGSEFVRVVKDGLPFRGVERHAESADSAAIDGDTALVGYLERD